MSVPSVIAIDGPAGSGKSTLGALLAGRLGYLYFDTGVMYRALAYIALARTHDIHDQVAIETLAAQTQIEVQPPQIADGRQATVLVDGTDVTWHLRTPAVEQAVSIIARYPGVRRELVRQQQQIGRRGQVVMVGRDIGTIVMPDAELKLYLETSLDERARRRAEQYQSANPEHSLSDIRAAIARRDSLDAHVLQAAPDAIRLQTDGMSPEQELEWLLAHMRQQANV
jgi:cytidylate kinase